MTETVLQDHKPWDDELAQLRADLDIEEKSAMYHIDRGRKGLNKGVSNGMPTLSKYIYGTQRGRYYLVGADSGVGKTTLTDFMFVYNLYKSCTALGIPLSILYFSFEISVVAKKGRWISLLYFLKYQEDLPSDAVYGWTDTHLLTDAQYAKLQPVVAEVEAMFKHINFVESSLDPYRMFNMMLHRAGAYGDLIKTSGMGNGPRAYVGYKNNTPGIMKVTILDHFALIDDMGQGTKKAMDAMSTLFVKARNLFDETVIAVQQFNTELQIVSREKKSKEAYAPTRQDLGDSKYTFRDADVVLGLTRPKDYQLDKVDCYDKLSKWGDFFLQLHIMKNRYGGGVGNYVPLFMNPVAGIPEELPIGGVWSANTLLQDHYIKRAGELRALAN